MIHEAILKPIVIDSIFYLQDKDDNIYCIEQYNDAIKNAHDIQKNIIIKYDNQIDNWSSFLTGNEITSVNKFPELLVYKKNIKKDDQYINNKEVNKIKTNEQEINNIDNYNLFLHTCYKYKPKNLIINETKWKFLIRNILRNKNTMISGHSGSGKTIAAMTTATILNRPLFIIPLGNSQDPRISLIGNTHFNKEMGTFFQRSYFIQAITTPNAIVLLEEISRAHPEANNILMTVLDEKQKYLRIDEEVDTPTIKVASGVSFISTANIGIEYTTTRKLDRALLDRFTIIEMDLLTYNEEIELLTDLYPTLPNKLIKCIADIACMTRKEINKADSKLSTIISTRYTVEAGSLAMDGFSIKEIAEILFYPLYSDYGGINSERTYIKQYIQQFLEDVIIDRKNIFNQ